MTRRIVGLVVGALFVASIAMAEEAAKPEGTSPAAVKRDAALKDVQTKMAKVKTASLDLSMKITLGPQTMEQTGSVKYLAPDKVALTTNREEPRKMTSTIISNGTTMWTIMESPERKMYRSVDVKKVSAAVKEAGLQQDNPTDIMTKPLLGLVDPTTATLEGIQQKEGVKCYVFSGKPMKGQEIPMLGVVKIYIGVDDGLPREMQTFTNQTGEGEPMMAMTFKNVKVNPALPESTFNYVAPDGVTVEDATDQIIQAAKRAAQMKEKAKQNANPAPEGEESK